MVEVPDGLAPKLALNADDERFSGRGERGFAFIGMGDVHDFPVVVPPYGPVKIVREEREAAAFVHDAAPGKAALQLGVVV